MNRSTNKVPARSTVWLSVVMVMALSLLSSRAESPQPDTATELRKDADPDVVITGPSPPPLEIRQDRYKMALWRRDQVAAGAMSRTGTHVAALEFNALADAVMEKAVAARGEKAQRLQEQADWYRQQAQVMERLATVEWEIDQLEMGRAERPGHELMAARQRLITQLRQLVLDDPQFRAAG